MPRNGSGQYDLPYDWNDDKANGIKVLASRMQAQDQDIANALTDSLSSDGQTPLTGNLDFNGHKCVDLVDGSDAGDSVNVSQVQTGELQFFGVSTTTPAGTNGLNYDLGPTPSITVYPDYAKFSFVCHFTCIANPIMRFGSLATKTLKKSDGANGYRALEAGDMVANKEYIGVINNDISSTDIIIENPENYSIESGPIQARTIATGIITIVKNYSSYSVDTEGAAASDDLDTINGGQDGQIIFIRSADNGRNVVVKHNTGNIFNPQNNNAATRDITLDVTTDFVLLRYSSAVAKWIVVSSSFNSFINSKTTNGYTYLPNGLIMQWGNKGSFSSSTTVTLPITFPNSALQSFCGGKTTADASSSFFSTSCTTTQLTIDSGTAASTTARWWVIGY